MGRFTEKGLKMLKKALSVKAKERPAVRDLNKYLKERWLREVKVLLLSSSPPSSLPRAPSDPGFQSASEDDLKGWRRHPRIPAAAPLTRSVPTTPGDEDGAPAPGMGKR